MSNLEEICTEAPKQIFDTFQVKMGMSVMIFTLAFSYLAF